METALGAGTMFAGYRIERMLGRGGMGTVYLAEHPRLPRSVALKLLARELFANAELRLRFEREADVAARLDHPNIVAVYDRGIEDDQLWISMQYVDGSDAARFRGEPMDPWRAVGVIAQTAEALDYAHEHGVLHRDVKPANIMLSPTRAGDRVLLSDFGIARLRDDTNGLTRTGSFVATLAYASPEQLSGLPLDHRADQYALGGTLFALLTGRVPFAATNPGAIVAAHLQQPVPRATALVPHLPAAVDEVIARAMAKRPELRFATCAELADAAAAALSGRSPAPPPLPPAPATPGTYPAAPTAQPGSAPTEPIPSGGPHPTAAPSSTGAPMPSVAPNQNPASPPNAAPRHAATPPPSGVPAPDGMPNPNFAPTLDARQGNSPLPADPSSHGAESVPGGGASRAPTPGRSPLSNAPSQGAAPDGVWNPGQASVPNVPRHAAAQLPSGVPAPDGASNSSFASTLDAGQESSPLPADLSSHGAGPLPGGGSSVVPTAGQASALSVPDGSPRHAAVLPPSGVPVAGGVSNSNFGEALEASHGNSSLPAEAPSHGAGVLLGGGSNGGTALGESPSSNVPGHSWVQSPGGGSSRGAGPLANGGPGPGGARADGDSGSNIPGGVAISGMSNAGVGPSSVLGPTPAQGGGANPGAVSVRGVSASEGVPSRGAAGVDRAPEMGDAWALGAGSGQDRSAVRPGGVPGSGVAPGGVLSRGGVPGAASSRHAAARRPAVRRLSRRRRRVLAALAVLCAFVLTVAALWEGKPQGDKASRAPWGAAQSIAEAFPGLIPAAPAELGWRGARCTKVDSISGPTNPPPQQQVACTDTDGVQIRYSQYAAEGDFAGYLAVAAHELTTNGSRDTPTGARVLVYRAPDTAAFGLLTRIRQNPSRNRILVEVSWPSHTFDEIYQHWWLQAPF